MAPTRMNRAGSDRAADDRGSAGSGLPPAVIVAGPTASGKSGLALAIAEAFRGTVVNADALQVYRELPLLSAQPGAAALARAPHRLYGILPAVERCSAGRWRALALEEMAAATAAGRLPVLTGGTGLYLKALQEGIAAVPPVPAAVREAAARRWQALGPAGFRAALLDRDPASARLHPNDRQRHLRAWEVLEATGRPLADWQSNAGGEAAPYRFLRIVLLPEREHLDAAIDRRFEAMLRAGALAEVAALLERRLDPALPAMKAIGLPELAAHLRGEVGLEAAAVAARSATRRYAKRQVTWLRGQMLGNQGVGFHLGQKATQLVVPSQFSQCGDEEIFANIRRFLLTALQQEA